MKVIIFGTGYIYKKYRFLLKMLDIDILCFIDNNNDKVGSIIDGVKVDSPDNINKYEFEYIFLMSTYVEAMREQLTSLGIQPKCIVSIADLIVSMDFVYRKAFDNKYDKKILLMSHVVNLSGAPIALFHMAVILKNAGYDVTVATVSSPDIEDLIYSYVKEEISVQVYADFKQLNIQMCGKIYDLIVVCTIAPFYLSKELSKLTCPVLWWLHEEDNFYQELIKEGNFFFDRGPNTYIYSGGNRAGASFEKYTGNKITANLLYGVPYVISKKEISNSKRMRFALMGYFCERKAQEVLLRAIQKNYTKWKDTTEFIFVGAIDEETKDRYERCENVKCIGVIDKDVLPDIYKQIDVLLCPSLNDPMPIVVTEAMMNKKLCLVSDMVGQASYIKPYETGIICKANDVDDLAEKIQWIMVNSNKISEIGERSFDIYKKYFSMESFKNNVLNIVDSYMKR